MPYANGESAVVVPTPALEPVVSAWRARFDASAPLGMPAHVTALAPFLPQERLTGETVAALRELCAAMPALDVEFRRTARFPGVLFLDPEPATGLVDLTSAIAERWPEAPPYGGVFAEIIPHLTVAYGAGAHVLDDVDAQLQRCLPVRTRLVEACLYVFDGRCWQAWARLPFHDGAVHDGR